MLSFYWNLKVVWIPTLLWLAALEVVITTTSGMTTTTSGATRDNKVGIMTDYSMMTSSNRNIFRVTGPLCGEFTATSHRWIPRTKASDADLWGSLWSGWWFEMPSHSLWRHRNVTTDYSAALLPQTLKQCKQKSVYQTTRWHNTFFL